MRPTSHSHPIVSYTKELSGSLLHARNQQDVEQNVARTFVNAGRLLRGLVDPRVKLAWKRADKGALEHRGGAKLLYWKPSRHQMRKREREHFGADRHYGEYRQASVEEQPIDERELEARKRDHAFSVAEKLLDARTGPNRRGPQKAELEEHAQAVIKEYADAGRIPLETLKEIQDARLIELQRGYVVKQRNGGLREVPAELLVEQQIAKKSEQDLSKQIDKLPAGVRDAEAQIKELEPQQQEALEEERAALQSQLKEARNNKAAVNADLKTAQLSTLMANLPPEKATELTTLLQQQWYELSYSDILKPQAEREAGKVADQIKTLKDWLDVNPVGPGSEDAQELDRLASESELANKGLKEIEQKLYDVDGTLHLHAQAIEKVEQAPIRKAELEEKLAQARKTLRDIQLEMEMTTSFVSLAAIDRMQGLGSAYFEIMAAIGQRWIDNGLVDEQAETSLHGSASLDESHPDLLIERFEPLDAGKLE